MKRIALTFFFTSFASVAPAEMADTVAVSTAPKTEVTSFISFHDYAAKEEAALKTQRVTIETGKVKDVLKKMGIELSDKLIYAFSKDGKKFAYKSPDKNGVAVIDGKSRHVEAYHANGKLLWRFPFLEYPDGIIAFSNTRLFVIGDGFGGCFGFKVFNSDGKTIKEIKDECVEGYMVSNTQKYFAVTSFTSDLDNHFVLYDIDGNELWRQKGVIGDHAEIQFTLDDKFVLIKIPRYWEEDKKFLPSKNVLKRNKAYVLDIGNHRVLSEEDYPA